MCIPYTGLLCILWFLYLSVSAFSTYVYILVKCSCGTLTFKMEAVPTVITTFLTTFVVQ